MNEVERLIARLDRIHTTEMGLDRIRRNLRLTVEDPVLWCKEKIASENCQVTRRGKNWYAQAEDWVITINAHSDTIITAHRVKR